MPSKCGRVAQLDRALASGAKGREFESRSAHQVISRDSAVLLDPFLLPKIYFLSLFLPSEKNKTPPNLAGFYSIYPPYMLNY